MTTSRTESDKREHLLKHKKIFDEGTFPIENKIIPAESLEDSLTTQYHRLPSEEQLIIPENKFKKNKIHIASQLVKDFQIKTKPMSQNEYPIVVFSGLAAFAAASAAHDFSKHFLNNVARIHGEPYVWAGTMMAFTPQFLLSLKTNIDRWSIICRSIPDATWADVRHNLKPIIVTGLSAIPTFKVAVDCEDFKSTPALGYTLGSLRSASALGFNGYFYVDHLQKQAQEKKKDLPIIKMLGDAKIAIGHAKSDTLIKAFQTESKTKNFLSHFNDHQDPIEQTNNIINLFIQLSEQHSQHNHVKTPHCTTFTSATSSLFGFLSSMMNWKAASKVPELFKLEVAKDILHFISKVLEEADPKLITAFIIGGAVIGLPSWYLNFLANRKACANAFERFCKIKDEGFKKHFWDKYKDCSSMLKDWSILLVTAVFSIGLGVANGGMAYRYPFLDFELVRIINAVSTGAVFMGLGFMSVDGFITAVEDKHDQKMLLDAFTAEDLQKYYDQLATEEKKHRFIILLKKYLQAVVDSLIGSFAKLDDSMLNELLSEENRQRLPQISKNGLFQYPGPAHTPVEGDYVAIERPEQVQSKPIQIRDGKKGTNETLLLMDEDVVEHEKTLKKSYEEAKHHERTFSFTEDNEDEDLTIVDFSPSM